MDERDQKLVSLLRHNARASISDLSLELGLSRNTVKARLERLVDEGEIVGFNVVLKGDLKRDPVRGLMMIGINGLGFERIIRQLYGLPQVRAVHSTNGQWDLIAEIGAQNLEEFDQVLFKIRKFDGIHASETNLMLTTHKSS